jgi:hypothetical protein
VLINENFCDRSKLFFFLGVKLKSYRAGQLRDQTGGTAGVPAATELETGKREDRRCDSVLWIHMFFGLLDPDPDPLVRGMDPDTTPNTDPDPSIS